MKKKKVIDDREREPEDHYLRLRVLLTETANQHHSEKKGPSAMEREKRQCAKEQVSPLLWREITRVIKIAS